MGIKRGILWKEMVRVSQQARHAGAMIHLPTDNESIEDSGVRFKVRILSTLGQKKIETLEQASGARSGKGDNPFLPYEEDLFVGALSDTHIALLNKFMVVEGHLLMVTRAYEDQEMLLTLKDFEALWFCMAEFNGLGFYNGGKAAGASQLHKHLQMIPLPLTPEGPSLPLEPLLASARFQGTLGWIPDLPFLHAFTRLDPQKIKLPRDGSEMLFSIYSEMLRSVGIKPSVSGPPQRQSAPYCFLVTRGWMLLVPRTRESFESISINSLGFAGFLLVRTQDELERLKAVGPMAVLKAVARSAVGFNRPSVLD